MAGTHDVFCYYVLVGRKGVIERGGLDEVEVVEVEERVPWPPHYGHWHQAIAAAAWEYRVWGIGVWGRRSGRRVKRGGGRGGALEGGRVYCLACFGSG